MKAKTNNQLARQFHHLQGEIIPKICAAMAVLLYWAEKVTTLN
jgi:hypothetical protein